MSVLERLRELERAATAAPWHADTDRSSGSGLGSLWALKWACQILRYSEGNPSCLADAELVAAARNALPVLFDIADAAREVTFDGTSRVALSHLHAAVARLDALVERAPEDASQNTNSSPGGGDGTC